MDYIKATRENLEQEHICCAISNNKDVQVLSKKTWLSERFVEGLVFLKSVERGKCFIEYIPAENAWIIRGFRCAMNRITAFSYGIYRLSRTQKNRSLRNVQGILE